MSSSICLEKARIRVLNFLISTIQFIYMKFKLSYQKKKLKHDFKRTFCDPQSQPLREKLRHSEQEMDPGTNTKVRSISYGKYGTEINCAVPCKISQSAQPLTQAPLLLFASKKQNSTKMFTRKLFTLLLIVTMATAARPGDESEYTFFYCSRICLATNFSTF